MPQAFAQKRTVTVKDTCSSFFREIYKFCFTICMPLQPVLIMHMLTNMNMRNNTRTHTHTRTHAHTHIHTHTHSHTYMRTHTYMNAHTHTCAHTHAHTHMHTHTHMQVYGTMSTFQYPLPAVRPNALWPTYNQRYVIHSIFSLHTVTKILLHEVKFL